MLLIIKLNFDQLSIYRKYVIECLKNNANNPYIKEILVFSDIVDEDLPKNNKIKYIIKPKYTDIEIVEYSKRISNSEYILFTKSIYTFKNELKDIKYRGPIRNNNFIFFRRDEYIRRDNIQEKIKNVVNETTKKIISTINPAKKIVRKLSVIMVSVNYNDYLKLTLEENKKIFDNITVVTSKEDKKCQKICQKNNVNCVISDNILKDGLINKSMGLNEAIKSLTDPDWILVLDADIIVKNKIDIENLDIEKLYTNSRYVIENIEEYNQYKKGLKDLSDFKYEKDKGIGFFQLFNYKTKKSYPDSNWGRYSESTWSDVIFKKSFKGRESLNLEIIHIGKPYQKWEKVDEKFHIDISNFDISILKKSKRDESIKPKLAVLTTFFNPNNYINIKYNYLKFSEKIKEKADLFPIELSFNDEFFIQDENVIQIYGTEDNILWQKERLLNIALENLPEEYTNVAWIDCDVLFENENWVDEINEKLNDYKVLQLYENAKRLNDNGGIDRVSEGIVKRISKTDIVEENLYGIPGFAWAIRREVIDEIKFLDTQIIGGGDALMFFSFFGMSNTIHHKKMNKEWHDVYMDWFSRAYFMVDESVNYITGDIIHLYHGKMTNRNYDKRYQILSHNNFNPKNDLLLDESGLWKLNDKIIVEKMSKYFESRDEDDNVIDINQYFDNIYVLNLDRRVDRYEKIKHKLDKLDIKFERFSAIDGNDIKDDEYDFSNFRHGYGMIENKYALGCLRSHIEIIKDAKSKGYKRILIFEDDVLISKDINIHLQKLRNIKDWKLLYLGSSQYNWNVEFIEDFYFTNNTLGCFAYAIDYSLYDEIIESNSEKYSVDNLIKNIQNKYQEKCYVFYPNICIADVSESTIRGERDQKSHSKKMRWDLLKNYF